ncbi:MAG: hypothetical protein H6625_00550 [Bdellovibrionaceae bacterium]|nr:hypothetical protein [Pseudobdellovibrionaceae bacterium]
MLRNLFLLIGAIIPITLASAGEALDSECNEDFLKVYSAKRSCILNNQQESCEDLNKWSIVYPIAGGAAGAFTVNLWNSFLTQRSDIPNAKALILKLNAVIKARKIVSQFTHNEDAKKEIIKKRYADAPHGESRLQEVLNAEQNGRQLEIDVRARQLYAKQLREAINNAKDPELKSTLESFASNELQQSKYRDFLSKHFPKDFDKVADIYDRHDGSKKSSQYKKLSKKHKVIFDLIEANESPSNKNSRGIKALKKSEARFADRSANIKTGVIVGTLLGDLFSKLTFLGFNILDKRNLELCKNELGLSDKDLTVLNGNSYVFSEAEAKSSTGLLSFTCSKLRIQNTDETISQVKHLNNDQISPGICKILKNEMKELDSVFESITSVRNTSCDGFKAANFEMRGDGFQKTFVYHFSENTKVEAPFDGKNGWPDFSSAKIFNNGNVNYIKTQEFIDKHQRYIPVNLSKDNPNPRWDLKEMTACLDSTNTTMECKMQRAAIASRLYYTNFRENCYPESTPSKGPSELPGKTQNKTN